jgi:hypothetical protein
MNARIHRALPGLVAFAFAGLFAALVLPALASAAANCPNEGARTGLSSFLPDCRAYEIVSPLDKNGGSVDGGTSLETGPDPSSSAADGHAVTYGSNTTFTEANPLSSLTTSQYISERTATGWTTRAVIPAQEYPDARVDISTDNLDEVPVQGFSEDLSHAFMVLNEPSPTPTAPMGYYNPYDFNAADNGYTLLSQVKPPVQPPGQPDKTRETPQDDGLISLFAGYSADDSHVVFEANDALTPRAVPGEENLYEYAAGHLELVSILPDGSAATGPTGTPYQPSFGAVVTGPVDGNNEHYHFAGSISADGNKVFWSAGGRVYMREDEVRTADVSASQRTDCADHNPCSGTPEPDPGGTKYATYQLANADGSLVYFTSCEKLTNDSTAHPPPAEYEVPSGRCISNGGSMNESFGQDLYQYDTDTGRLTDMTVSHLEVPLTEEPGRSIQGAEVLGMLGESSDGSYVYFAARGALAPGASTLKARGSANVYVWHDGEVKFVANIKNETAFKPGLDERTSRVSPDGLYLAFDEAESRLTGNDNTPLNTRDCALASQEFAPRNICTEVYEYRATTNTLECASCTAANLPPTGNSVVPIAAGVGGRLEGWQDDVTQQRYLLDDGRLFFESGNRLLPQASNGQPNVYEREPDGVGSCQTAGGCLYLVTSGTSQKPSYFIDASESGEDVFVETVDKLVPADRDEAQDVYDVRVDGGFPSYTPPPCSGEACKPPVTPAPPIYQAPPSATFFGAGNPAQALTKAVRAKPKKKARSKRKKAKKKAKGRHASVTHAEKSGRTSSSVGNSAKGRK